MKKQLTGILFAAGFALAAAFPSFAAGWQQDAAGWWYQNDDGSYPRDSWLRVGGTWYYFDGNGYMATGWRNIGNTWYYLDANGAMHTGWLDVDGERYYLDKDGAMKTGFFHISSELPKSEYLYQAYADGSLKRGLTESDGTRKVHYDKDGIIQYKTGNSTLAGDANDLSAWRYIYNISDIDQETKQDANLVKSERQDLMIRYKSDFDDNVRGKDSRKYPKALERWQSRVRYAMSGYLSPEEIEDYIDFVSHYSRPDIDFGDSTTIDDDGLTEAFGYDYFNEKYFS